MTPAIAKIEAIIAIKIFNPSTSKTILIAKPPSVSVAEPPKT